MNKLQKLRVWANKDDGSFYQVGNQALSWLEVIGYLLIIASLVVWLLVNKAGIEPAWTGWLCFTAGLLLAVIGVHKRLRQGHEAG